MIVQNPRLLGNRARSIASGKLQALPTFPVRNEDQLNHRDWGREQESQELTAGVAPMRCTRGKGQEATGLSRTVCVLAVPRILSLGVFGSEPQRP